MLKSKHIEDEDVLVAALRSMWAVRQRTDLDTRHAMGALINNKIGPPCRRQVYGAGTVNRICEELNLSKSEISRMRRFAYLFESVKEMLRKYPHATSWSRVHCILPQQSTAKNAQDWRTFTGMQRSLRSLIDSLEKTGHVPPGHYRDQLQELFDELYALAKQHVYAE